MQKLTFQFKLIEINMIQFRKCIIVAHKLRIMNNEIYYSVHVEFCMKHVLEYLFIYRIFF